MIRLTYNGMRAEYPTIEAAIMPLRECLADGPGVAVTVEVVKMPTIAAERIINGKPRTPIRILGSVRATNMVRIASLVPDGYTAPTFRAEVRHLSALADLAVEGRTGAVTLSDGSRIVTRCL